MPNTINLNGNYYGLSFNIPSLSPYDNANVTFFQTGTNNIIYQLPIDKNNFNLPFEIVIPEGINIKNTTLIIKCLFYNNSNSNNILIHILFKQKDTVILDDVEIIANTGINTRSFIYDII